VWWYKGAGEGHTCMDWMLLDMLICTEIFFAMKALVA
jgi:hypothetical protein